ncbi:MAG: 50S ribosomal protein L9 [Halobacteriovoraceae bacterium]|nr:50S ribosomal protein L9 [Halobacteriovoraceae bacterium]
MKVILTERVKALGNIGEIVNVSEGYARNFLIPKRMAKLADEGNSKQMADYQKMLAKRIEEEKAAAQAMKKELDGMKITVFKKIGGNGRLFGTVTNTEIAKELEKQNIVIERRVIHIPTPIKTLGEFEVVAKLFSDVEASFTVNVEMDPKQVEEQQKKQAAAEKKAKAKEAKAAEEATAETEEGSSEETTEQA